MPSPAHSKSSVPVPRKDASEQLMPYLPASREARTPVLALFVAADYLLTTLVVIVFATGALVPVTQASGGLLSRALLGNLLLLALVIGVLVLGIGRLRAQDIGLRARDLPAGIAVTVGLWAMVQVLQAAGGLLFDGGIVISPAWSQPGAPAVVGALLGQLLGNALYEDIGYRGFLFPHMLLRLERRWPGSSRRALVAALLLSQALFALRHIPSRVLNGVGAGGVALDLLRLTVVGVLLALLYLRTRNLFIVIGAHALIDAPTELFAATLIGPSNLAVVLVVVLLLTWPTGRRASRST